MPKAKSGKAAGKLAPDLRLSLRMRHDLDRSFERFDRAFQKTLMSAPIPVGEKKTLKVRFKKLSEAVSSMAYGVVPR